MDPVGWKGLHPLLPSCVNLLVFTDNPYPSSLSVTYLGVETDIIKPPTTSFQQSGQCPCTLIPSTRATRGFDTIGTSHIHLILVLQLFYQVWKETFYCRKKKSWKAAKITCRWVPCTSVDKRGEDDGSYNKGD